MDFRILGPLDVRSSDGVLVDIPRPQHRALLCVLLLHAGEIVSRATVYEALWGAALPHDPGTALRSCIYGLRKAIGDSDRLLTRNARYRFELADDDYLDLLTFRQLVEEGRRALSVGDYAHAAKLLGDALGLWREPALADFPELTLAFGGPAALLQGRIVVQEALADARLALGDHYSLTVWLRELAAVEPLRERRWEQLMLAQYRSGMQADALASYLQARNILRDECGIDPGPGLRELHQRILDRDPALAWNPPNAAVEGAGRELRIDSGAALRDAPRTVLRQEVTPARPRGGWRKVYQLPAAPANFTGRAADRDALTGALIAPDGHPVVPVAVVSGPPGIGKTALALYAAHTAGPRFPDGQLWVPLDGALARPRHPGEVLGEMLRALGVPGPAIPDDYSERPAALRSVLAGRKVLVVADDAATAEQVAPLLPGTPGCAVIVTSRNQLHGLVGARQIPLEPLPTGDAVGLLGKIAGDQRVTADPGAAARLAELCGGLPLALCIAGGKLATRPQWPLSAMIRRLTRAHSRLSELEAGNLSVRAGIAATYGALPESHRLAFRRLALLGPGDFAPWVVPVLADQPGAERVLDDLVDSSLVGTAGVDTVGEPRYRLHDLLREYAAEKLAADPAASTDAALERLLRAWLQLAQAADASLPPEPYFPRTTPGPRPAVVPQALADDLTSSPVAWFTAERTNLMTAVERACQAGQPELAWQITAHCAAFHHLQDRYDDAEVLWRAVAPHLAGPSAAVLSQIRVVASAVIGGRAAEALTTLNGCVTLAKSLHDPELLSFALYWRATGAWDVDDYAGARRDAEQGIRAARTAGSRHGELLNLRVLAASLALTGDKTRAVACAEQALTIATELGDRSSELAALHHFAYVCTLAGNDDRAVILSLQRIELSQELGDARAEALARAVLGDAYRGLGKYALAIDSLLRALPVLRAHHAARHAALCLLKLGFAHEALGDHSQAIGYLEEARQTFGQLRLPRKAEQAEQALDRCRAASAAPASR